jgi:hypothetical protein
MRNTNCISNLAVLLKHSNEGKEELSLSLTKYHTMKMYGSVVNLHLCHF